MPSLIDGGGETSEAAAPMPPEQATPPRPVAVVTGGSSGIGKAFVAALHSLSKSLRRQLAPLDITVTEVAPPVVDTPAVAHRQVPKMPAEKVIALALAAASKGVAEVYPGRARWLPLLLRIVPSVGEAWWREPESAALRGRP